MRKVSELDIIVTDSTLWSRQGGVVVVVRYRQLMLKLALLVSE